MGFPAPWTMPEMQASFFFAVSCILFGIGLPYFWGWLFGSFWVHLFISLLLTFWGTRRIAKGGISQDLLQDPMLLSKTAIITGGNTGIGKATAIELARLGCKVVLACRSKQRGEKAVEEIIKEANKRKPQSIKTTDICVEFKQLDLANIKSIKEFTNSWKDQRNQDDQQIDFLINNAGVMMCPFTKTADGFEMQFGTNHIGHFVLTTELLDIIKSCSSRVVTVSSVGHSLAGPAPIPWDKLTEIKYDPVTFYGYSKLANLFFTKELQKRLEGSGAKATAVHPGFVDTELVRHFNAVIRAIAYPLIQTIAKTPLEGSQTTLHCCLSHNIWAGCYYEDCRLGVLSKQAQDDSEPARLWKITEQLLSNVEAYKS